MYKPILTIDLPKLRDNAATELHELGDLGIEEMAVNKVFDGCVETAKGLRPSRNPAFITSRNLRMPSIARHVCSVVLDCLKSRMSSAMPTFP